MSKQFLAILAAIVLIFVGIIAFGGKSDNSGSGSGGTSTRHIEGQGKDGITLVEYGDYQCPFCGQYYPIIKQVQAEYDQQLFFQFRNFPLSNLHPNAFAASRAAEAAGLQNKFWQMHDALYEQNELSQADPKASTWVKATDPTGFFNQYAQQLGMNLGKFKADYASSKVNDLVNADIAAGTKLNVQGTPTFYLDGKEISVGQKVSDFEAVINAEIAKKTGKSSGGPANTGTTSQTTAPAKQ